MTATAITFETVDEAIEATVRPVLLYVRIGGEVVNATEAHTRHGVDMLVGTCTIYCAAPRTDAMTINAEIEIEAGYPGAVRRIFKGFIPNDESITNDRGHMLRIDGVGWASRLTWPSLAGVEITGPVSLKDVFRSLCALRELPTYVSDDTTYVGGSEIILGGNELVNGGHVRLDSRTAPADWLRRLPPLFGYYAFDSPDGAVRLARVSGLPPLDLLGELEPEEITAGLALTVDTDSGLYNGSETVEGARFVDTVTGGSNVIATSATGAQPSVGNPSFTDDISQWIERWNPNGFVYSVSRDASVFGDSAGSLKVAITAVPSGIGTGHNMVYGPDFAYAVPANGGHVYSWTAQVRKDHATDLTLKIVSEFFDADGAFLGGTSSGPAPDVANTWHTLTATGIAPDGTRYQMVTFEIVHNVDPIAATRTAWIDAIEPGDDAAFWVQVNASGLGTGWMESTSLGVLLTPPMHYQEGINCYSLQRSRDREPMETWIEVEGARYTGEDGGPVQIRSVPDEVPYAAELDPPGYQHASYSSQDLVTDTQAQGVRNALEVDRSEVYELLTWEAAGRPDLQPGDVVMVTGMHHDITNQRVWLMSLDQSVTDRGYIARMSGWFGAGQALGAANDCFTVSVGSGTYHVGEETLSHYRDPSPDGTTIVIPIDVEFADYTSLRLTGIAHGTNSRSRGGLGNHINTQLLQLPFYSRDRASSLGSTFARKVRDEGYGVVGEARNEAIEAFNEDYPGNTAAFRKYLDAIVADSKKPGSRPTTGSQIEIWQKPDPTAAESGTNELTRVGTMDLPTLDEELNLRRNYSSTDRYWTAFSLPVPGTLLEGDAELVLVAGSETSGEETTFDDYEIEDLQLTYCGIGVPELPGDAE
jgi:hypothetical protein